MPKVKSYASKHTSNINQEKPGKRSPANEIQQQIQDGLAAHYMQRTAKQNPLLVVVEDDSFSDDNYDAPDADNYNDDGQDDDTASTVCYPNTDTDETSSEESAELNTPRRFTMIVESDDSDDEEQNINTKDTRAQKIAHDAEMRYRLFYRKTVANRDKQPEHGHQSGNEFK